MKSSIPRNQFDLSHFSFNVGAIGSLQTIALVPVVAGDSMKLDFTSVFRLSPLRRNLYLDCQVDLFAFYVPHRHVYGDDWITFMNAGTDEAVTFGTYTLNATVENHCCGTHLAEGSVVPKWILAGYSQIWNRYFKDPTQADMAENFFEADSSSKNLYGQCCCFVKRTWNSTVTSAVDSSDYNVAVGGGGTTMSLLDFAAQQGRLESERKREWFGVRYADVIKQIYGSHISNEVEPYPYLIARKKDFLSGYDVDGSDDASLGRCTGLSKGVCSLRFPWRYFPEHGALWIMALVRFCSPVVYWENHYLSQPANAEPTYKQISGDPDLWSVEPPKTLVDGDVWYQNAGANSLGLIGYGHWYREHPHFVHPLYITVDGHPFLNTTFTSKALAAYHTTDMYDDIFTSLKLKHWQSQGHVGLQAKRVVPDVRRSIFAGTK